MTEDLQLTAEPPTAACCDLATTPVTAESAERLAPMFKALGDPVRLRQVLDIVLTNAAQAQEKGQIDVGARASGEFISVIVRDRGPGVSPELRDRIFDPLVTSKARGTGLGLALSRQIVERHGGKLKLLETSSKGATFEIRLPVAFGAAERKG